MRACVCMYVHVYVYVCVRAYARVCVCVCMCAVCIITNIWPDIEICKMACRSIKEFDKPMKDSSDIGVLLLTRPRLYSAPKIHLITC